MLASSDQAREIALVTWVCVVRGIQTFEGRSSFKTWLLRIVVNNACSRGVHERRMIRWGALGGEATDWERCLPSEASTPETSALGAEARRMLEHAIATLPERQRAVVVQRDVKGWSSEEVRAAMGISAGNQRVLLHRARIQLRAALRPYVDDPQLA